MTIQSESVQGKSLVPKLWFTRCPFCQRTAWTHTVEQYARCPDCGQGVEYEGQYDHTQKKVIRIKIDQPLVMRLEE